MRYIDSLVYNLKGQISYRNRSSNFFVKQDLRLRCFLRVLVLSSCESAVTLQCLYWVPFFQSPDHPGHSVQELPKSWRKHLLKRAKQGRMIIYLRGLDKRIWPTFYHCVSGFNVLTCGWKQVTAAYGLNPGDDCLFQLVDQQKRIFDVRKIWKSRSKMPKNYLELFTLSTYKRNEKKGAMPVSH